MRNPFSIGTASPLRRSAQGAALALLTGAGLVGQQWLSGFEVTGRNGAGLAYDAARAQTVLFGGYTSNSDSDETWLFDGMDWRRAQPANRPAARRVSALAYDTARGRVVLFGGILASNARAGDTWEYDGTNWTQGFPAHAPSARATAVTYDAANARVVLFGGEDTAYRNDTWVYDGTDWVQVATQTLPGARSWHALAHDTVRGRTVLFGGNGSTLLLDTYEFDGVDWARVTTANAPSPRRSHGMTFDPTRGRIVLFGGTSPGALLAPNLADTWEYDGVDWSRVTPANSPTPQWTTSLAYDIARQRTVLVGSGDGGQTERVDTWTFDGIDWTFRSTPSSRDRPALAHDTLRGRTVMFGGQSLQDTWEHDGTRWQRIATTAPLRLGGAATAFDPLRARTVLFGGSYLWAVYDETWEYDGAAWTTVPMAVRPPPRALLAMAHDPARRRVVLFGGQTINPVTYYNDTWEYDGATWRLIVPASILPAARSATAIVYESSRSRILLFGGTNSSSGAGFSDTWVYDGATWQQLAPANRPSARNGHGLAYDVLRGRTLLFGGRGANAVALADTWEFDGASWSIVTTAAPPFARQCSMVFQQHTGRVLSFGGIDNLNHAIGETILFVPAATATFARHGRGCPGSAGIPVLDTVPPAVPALGTSFPLHLSGLPAAPGVAMLAFGFDLVRWNSAALPLGLAAFGLPGCDLWIGPEPGFSVLVPYAGTATYALALPGTPALAGLVAAAQALVFDSGAPSGLGSVTNAAILRLH